MTARAVTLPDGPVVVDASFLIALMVRDVNAARFVTVVPRAQIVAVNFGEVLYKSLEKVNRAPSDVEAMLDGIGLTITDLDVRHARRFPELKRIDNTTRGTDATKSLSLGDMACLAFAWEAGLPVLTGDKHWLALPPFGLRVEVYDYADPMLTN